MITQIFPAVKAIYTHAAIYSRPNSEPLSRCIYCDKFMPRYSGKDQVSVALIPHLGICSANGTILNPQKFETLPGFRFCGVLQFQVSQSGK
jgi:hypothetical protein